MANITNNMLLQSERYLEGLPFQLDTNHNGQEPDTSSAMHRNAHFLLVVGDKMI